jgi:N-acetylglucosaminyldiphosphoundecaprenol N-acetyl-beta-D-mannosaminyltransferase
MSADILGVRIDALTIDQAVAQALGAMEQGTGGYICTPNPEILWLAQRDQALRQALNGAYMTLADGVGVVWAAKYLGHPVPERVAGYDFMMALLAKMSGRVFLLGGQPGVAQEAAQAIRRQFSAVEIVGTHDGYFSQSEPVLAEIQAAQPQLVLVCLGAPKQEKWMAEFAPALPGCLLAGLGGCLDVLAGRVQRAPDWWIRHKLEWLYRLIRQPQRIKRQLRLPRFVLAVAKQRMQDGKR